MFNVIWPLAKVLGRLNIHIFIKYFSFNIQIHLRGIKIILFIIGLYLKIVTINVITWSFIISQIATLSFQFYFTLHSVFFHAHLSKKKQFHCNLKYDTYAIPIKAICKRCKNYHTFQIRRKIIKKIIRCANRCHPKLLIHNGIYTQYNIRKIVQ